VAERGRHRRLRRGVRAYGISRRSQLVHNIDRNWELLAPFAGARVAVPALYVAGDRDPVLAFRGMDRLVPNLATLVPQLRRTLILPGCGHWAQQERADEVSAAMVDFLRGM